MASFTNTSCNGLASLVPTCHTSNAISKHPSLIILSSKNLSRTCYNKVSSLNYNYIRGEKAKQGIIVIRASETETVATEKLGIKIIENPPESKLTELGVRSWPKWGCPPSKFPWTYSSKETCYLLKGKVKVYPDGSDEGVEIGAGDMVEFPKGMSCTWDVSETVDKHYQFE